MKINAAFQWKRHPKAEALLENFLSNACEQNSFIDNLANDLLTQTSSRLFDWVNHLVVGGAPELLNELDEYGFFVELAAASYRVYHHPGAQLPRLVVRDHFKPLAGVAVNVDSIADFLMVRGLSSSIEGSPFSGYRRSCVSTENQVSLWVVERRGVRTMEPTYYEDGYVKKYFAAKEKWQSRPRNLVDEDEALAQTLAIADEIVALLGTDAAACLVLECERAYWQARNIAGQVQKNRQDSLGMGWANHDHHTFRSTRRHFTQLVRLFEIFGFHCRERFYAGKEAGWGAQVMENPRCRLVLFLDVDLAADEIIIDFAHQPLPPFKSLGTIGLWCGLHGDSILKAGMHHLEAQFMFKDLKRDLRQRGVGMMQPFSSFSYLKQAFTQGEIWPVDPRRVEVLLETKKITQAEAEKFLSQGAIGSHLENLQRRCGYKGFNQKNVSFIIKKTDPRHIKDEKRPISG